MRPDDDGAALDGRGQAEIEGRAKAGTADAPAPGAPPAGPHGTPELTEPGATPGTGALPDPGPDDEADAATG
ncbi:hypothetical protein [Lichenibacterium dinghuense]|uniref:hypothetical protein n=1 Tax=Lichenibacterium dinghuense TaxID=2895977 RepID=UPI001F1E0108|nr:hypothetical protein [Lichenibacterium sp. 6Y81]